MGLAALGALIAIALAYLAQSPRLLKRLGLYGYRLDLRTRAFTGYGLALLLLALGFFVAGVPLGGAESPAVAAATATTTPTPEFENTGATVTPTTAVVAATAAETPTGTPRPASGAFGSPRTATPSPDDAAPTMETAVTPSPTLTTTSETSATAPAPTPTPTPTVTPSPTPTPTPTITPTPIVGETAVVNTGSSTVWIKRAPGGQNLVLVRGGDILILLPSHANRGGVLWREVSTVDGISGWLQVSFLSFTDEQTQP
jgi:hypothetical protein